MTSWMDDVGKTIYMLQKYEHPNIGLTTDELKELRGLLSSTSREIADAIAQRVEEEGE